MSHRACYIVAAALPPRFGWQVRARGVRAEQLAAQARLSFEEVHIILFLERFDNINADRGFAILAPAREDTTLIPVGAFEAFADRLPPSTFVFSQSEFVEKAAHAALRHDVVYDILAPSEVTLRQSGASDAEIRQLQFSHRRMVRLARRIIVNGEKSARYFADDLREREHVIAPLAPELTDAGPRTRTHLLFGGPFPRWTDVTPIFATMSAFAAASPQVPIIMMAPRGLKEDANALEYSALWLMPQVTPMWNLSAQNDAEILSRCFGFVDWAPLNGERAHTTSLRTLQAVAAGVPVLHQMGTGLDLLWDPFPGERLATPITPQDVAAFVAKAKAGVYREAVESARRQLSGLRSDPTPFAGLAA
ncbi:MAG: hypothetical protein AcusKO_26220 [Acuticoccus sp.]